MEKLDEEDIAHQIKPRDQKPVPAKIGPKNDHLKFTSLEKVERSKNPETGPDQKTSG